MLDAVTGSPDPNHGTSDVAAIADEVVESLQQLAGDRRITPSSSRTHHPEVGTNAATLRRAVMALVDNALAQPGAKARRQRRRFPH